MAARSRYRSRYRSRRGRGGGFSASSVVAVVAVLALAGAVTWYVVNENDDGPDDLGAAQGCPTEPGKVAIAYGARANSPAPFLPDEIVDLLKATADAEKEIVVYRVDGDPTEAFRNRFSSLTRPKKPRELEVEDYVGRVEQLLTGIRPVEPEAAPLAAVTLAARDTRPGDTVILIDSGLQTVAPLDFRTPGWLLAEPDDVVTSLAEARAIPDLVGRRVILLGIGDTIEPQQDLDGPRRDNLIDIWEAIVAASGATCVEVLPYPPRDETPIPGVVPVSEVPIPQPEPPAMVSCGDDLVLYNGEAVGFEPDQAIFRDREGAARFLQPYVELIRNEERRVHLIGTTARWGSEQGQRDLALRRAEAVKALLVEMGVPADWITTEGAGSYSDYYQPDGGPERPGRWLGHDSSDLHR